ncbi:MAG: riboflavin synthase [Kofleriaceae bacterium]
MFTGLIEDLGTVARADRRSDALVLTVRPAALPVAELGLGDSVAHDGVCLTVTAVGADTYQVLAGAETLAKTTLGERRVGDRLHLERALALGARLGGHLVAGHVDGVGELVAREDRGANVVLRFRPPGELLRYVISKGSIAIDGVSLTVNTVDDDSFAVAIIPHTVTATHLAQRRPGARVNLEVDLIGKYVERLVAPLPGRPRRWP